MFSSERWMPGSSKGIESASHPIPESISEQVDAIVKEHLDQSGKIKDTYAFAQAIQGLIPESVYHEVSQAVMQLHRNNERPLVRTMLDRVRGEKHDGPLMRVAETDADPWIRVVRNLEIKHQIRIMGTTH